MDILNLITLPLLTLTLSVTCGQLGRRVPKYGWLVTAIGLLFTLLPPLFHEVFSLQFLGISLFGFFTGRFVSLSDKALGRWYVTALVAAVGIVLSDLLYESGIGRFGLPSLAELFDPSLAAFFMVEAFIESLLAAVCALCWYSLTRGITRIREAPQVTSGIFWPFFACAVIIYALEPLFHLRIQHPYWIHNPFVTFATLGGFVLGYLAGRCGALPAYRPISPDSLALAFTAYFFIYHLVTETSERTSGPFSIAYGWQTLLIFTLTLPFGTMFGVLRSRNHDKRYPTTAV